MGGGGVVGGRGGGRVPVGVEGVGEVEKGWGAGFGVVDKREREGGFEFDKKIMEG